MVKRVVLILFGLILCCCAGLWCLSGGGIIIRQGTDYAPTFRLDGHTWPAGADVRVLAVYSDINSWHGSSNPVDVVRIDPDAEGVYHVPRRWTWVERSAWGDDGSLDARVYVLDERGVHCTAAAHHNQNLFTRESPHGSVVDGVLRPDGPLQPDPKQVNELFYQLGVWGLHGLEGNWQWETVLHRDAAEKLARIVTDYGHLFDEPTHAVWRRVGQHGDVPLKLERGTVEQLDQNRGDMAAWVAALPHEERRWFVGEDYTPPAATQPGVDHADDADGGGV